MPDSVHTSRPIGPWRWSVAGAFTLLYLAWGTTYFAIRVGVHQEHMPPAVFSGSRVCVAGLLVLVFLGLRGSRVRLHGAEWTSAIIGAVLLFVVGNGLIALALEDVPSSVAAVIIATTPLWTASLEALLPRGDRLSMLGWFGVLIGLAGVVVLVADQVDIWKASCADYRGIALGLASAFAWAVGSLALRYRARPASHLASAAYQMVFGGAGLAVVGLIFGEGPAVPWPISSHAMMAFLWLLVVGALIGFVAFNWLLGQVSATRVGTYAYVNPVVAIIVAWLLGDGVLTLPMLGAMAIILTGVALVRRGGSRTVLGIARDQRRVARLDPDNCSLAASELAKTTNCAGRRI